MSVDLSVHHNWEVAILKLWEDTKLKPEITLIFGCDLHCNCVSNWDAITSNTINRRIFINNLRHFLNIPEWDGAWIVILMLVFSLSVFYKSNPIVTDYKPPKNTWSWIVGTPFSPHIIAQFNLFTRFESILVHWSLFQKCLVHILIRCIILLILDVVVVDHWSLVYFTSLTYGPVAALGFLHTLWLTK